ncbi:hypothetical protein pv_82 [Pithovirus sibericum]|uniref:Uncharacterized protein n=1 Tax=Pithovirus sibericum TaxID=1450746 RepID=W5S4S4_9VIRU|nr:hypothetical protein pv_82 [Pithovirus sibericum]AHH01649.1 hypothetical protein pv_82 [Pithovirus sibericum]
METEFFPREITEHILSFNDYETIRSAYPERIFSDSFWKNKAFLDWNFPKERFDRFKSYNILSEERYLQIGLNFRPIQNNLKVISPQLYLKKLSRNCSIGEFEDIEKKIGSDISQRGFYAKEALDAENFKLYLHLDSERFFLKGSLRVLFQESLMTNKDAEEAINSPFLFQILLSSPDDLSIFDNKIESQVTLPNGGYDQLVLKVCSMCLKSKFPEKVKRILQFFDENMPSGSGEFGGDRFLFHYAMLKYRSEHYFPYVERILNQLPDFISSEFGSNLSPTDKFYLSSHYGGYCSSALMSLDETRINKVLNQGFLLSLYDFSQILTKENSTLLEKKILLFEKYLTPDNEENFVSFDENWTKGFDKKEMENLAASLVINGELDLFDYLVCSFKEFFDQIDTDLVSKALKEGQLLMANYLICLIRQKKF